MRLITSRRLVPILFLMGASAFGATLKGVTLPDSMQTGGKSLALNGLGVRQATVFKVNVYVAGLYLEAVSRDSAQILGSTSLKRLHMKFLRDVDHDKIVDAFREGFKGCARGCDAALKGLARLSPFIPDMKEGGEMDYVFHPDRVEFRISAVGPTEGTRTHEVAGADFSRELLAVWIGPRPPTEDLKAGLLGQLK